MDLLMGASPAMQRLRSVIGRIAGSKSTTLIVGESGTGKELVARALHGQGMPAAAPFVPVNCAALARDLLDSELFGHEKGAFTGAHTRHTGLFDAANGGVLFLDEIGEMPLSTQAHLLRAIQEGEVRPLGASTSHKVNVWVIAATNVDLPRAVREGAFREDLYYRLSTLVVHTPPLRDRLEDLPELCQRLLSGIAARRDLRPKPLSTETLACLYRHRWPGNVRELENALEYALTFCDGPMLLPEHLPEPLCPSDHEGLTPFTEAREEMLRTFELSYLDRLLRGTGGNLSEAARRARMDRSNLRRLLKQYGLRPSDFISHRASTDA